MSGPGRKVPGLTISSPMVEVLQRIRIISGKGALKRREQRWMPQETCGAVVVVPDCSRESLQPECV